MAWAASLVLGAAFVVAGAAKLAGGDRWAAQVRALGVDARIAATVPWIELVVGAVAATRLAHPAGAVAAIVVLVVFTAWIGAQLRRGAAAPCACFGGLSRRPMSWRDIARNLGLLAVAVVALVA